MRAWLLDKTGSLAGLAMGSAPTPVPGPGEALLRLRCAGLNPADRYLAEGQYPARPAFPHILGRDGTGEVEAVGPGVQGLKAGDRRLILRGETGVSRWGTFAQYAVAAADSLAEVPPDWTPEQAGSAPLTYLTAYQALSMWGPLKPGAVLVTGASGGVGVAAVQLAAAMGHRVFALTRDPAKGERLKDQGAQAAFSPADRAWVRLVKEALQGGRVDLAIDNLGGELFNQVLEVLGDQAKISCVGRLVGPVPSFNTASLFFRRLRLGGVSVGAYSAAETQAAWAAVLGLLRKTQRSPLVDSAWDFERLPEAFARLAAGPLGKVVLKVP